MTAASLKRSFHILPLASARARVGAPANDNFHHLVANDNKRRDVAGQIAYVSSIQPGHSCTNLASSIAPMAR
jgi:hypothetical protein